MTDTPSEKGYKRDLYILDAKEKILGRLATDAATHLLGKHKVDYVANINIGDVVVILNAPLFVTTGRKEEQKLYTNYSGYPDGLKTRKLGEMKKKNPTEVIKRAVSGMLPNNKLRDTYMKNLLVFNSDSYQLPKEYKEITKSTTVNGQTEK